MNKDQLKDLVKSYFNLTEVVATEEVATEEVEMSAETETTEEVVEEQVEMSAKETTEEVVETPAEVEMSEEIKEEVAEVAMEEGVVEEAPAKEAPAEPAVSTEEVVSMVMEAVAEEMGKLKEDMDALRSKVEEMAGQPAAEPTNVDAAQENKFTSMTSAGNPMLNVMLKEIKNKK